MALLEKLTNLLTPSMSDKDHTIDEIRLVCVDDKTGARKTVTLTEVLRAAATEIGMRPDGDEVKGLNNYLGEEFLKLWEISVSEAILNVVTSRLGKHDTMGDSVYLWNFSNGDIRLAFDRSAFTLEFIPDDETCGTPREISSAVLFGTPVDIASKVAQWMDSHFVVFQYTNHKAMWSWLAANPKKDKEDWPEWVRNGGKVPSVQGLCFACETHKDIKNRLKSVRIMSACNDHCPLVVPTELRRAISRAHGLGEDEGCLYGLYSRFTESNTRSECIEAASAIWGLAPKIRIPDTDIQLLLK